MPLGEEERHKRSGDQEVAAQVGGDHVGKTLGRDLPERLRRFEEVRVDGAHTDAGVVDEEVQPAPTRADLLCGGHRRACLANIERQRLGG